MARSRRPVPGLAPLDPDLPATALTSPGAPGLAALTRLAGGGNAWMAELLGAPVSGALEACFGPGVRGLDLATGQDRENQDIGALASAEGRRVSLSSQIQPERGDRQSLEVLGHEIAHGLAGGGSGAHALDQPGDPGEARADQAGARFADFVLGGMQGPAPRLSPATGGRARVHRWESSEHKDAVDGAAERLEDEGYAVDPAVAEQMAAPVTLGNGLSLTPGQITALMGDFYGVFDEEGNFDPAASFEQLWSADPREMQALLDQIAIEAGGDEISPNTWQDITAGRESRGQLPYLELAERNNSHFSGPTMAGTDNNMGTYTALHEMALKAAADGDPNRARALEASSMHYLTDRHSGGHTFNKQGVMEASGHEPGDIWANVHVKWLHDQLNEDGALVWSAAPEDGGLFEAGLYRPEEPTTWTALGDGHWKNKDDVRERGDPNEENRLRTSQSVYASYSELEDVLSGERTPEDVQAGGYHAHATVPQWSDERQEGMELITRYLDENRGGDTYINAPYVDDAAEILWGQHVAAPAAEAWESVTRFPGEVQSGLEEAWRQMNDPYNWIRLCGGGY